jgi:hypothetical protein
MGCNCSGYCVSDVAVMVMVIVIVENEEWLEAVCLGEDQLGVQLGRLEKRPLVNPA